MNEHEIARLADGLHRIRPDWPIRQLTTLLNTDSLRDRPRRDVLVALAWVAAEAGTSSPYRVLEAGPWWRAAAVDGTTTSNRDNPDATERCSVCSLSAGRCRQLWANNHDYVPATATRTWKSAPDRAKSVTDALRAEVLPLRQPDPPIDLAERRTGKSDAARAAIQNPAQETTPPGGATPDGASTTTDPTEVTS